MARACLILSSRSSILNRSICRSTALRASFSLESSLTSPLAAQLRTCRKERVAQATSADDAFLGALLKVEVTDRLHVPRGDKEASSGARSKHGRNGARQTWAYLLAQSLQLLQLLLHFANNLVALAGILEKGGASSSSMWACLSVTPQAARIAARSARCLLVACVARTSVSSSLSQSASQSATPSLTRLSVCSISAEMGMSGEVGRDSCKAFRALYSSIDALQPDCSLRSLDMTLDCHFKWPRRAF